LDDRTVVGIQVSLMMGGEKIHFQTKPCGSKLIPEVNEPVAQIRYPRHDVEENAALKWKLFRTWPIIHRYSVHEPDAVVETLKVFGVSNAPMKPKIPVPLPIQVPIQHFQQEGRHGVEEQLA
jgi:hypothetical protein